MGTLPPFIMTSEKGSYARKTIEELKPGIIDNLLEVYDYTPEIQSTLLDFKLELSKGPIRPLMEQTSDKPIWDEDLKRYKGKTWLEIPWLLAETYFFRRILEIVCYFQPGPWQGRDPYQHLKDREISKALQDFIKDYHPETLAANYASFQIACQDALWGNQSDLSNLEKYASSEIPDSEKYILNQSKAAFDYLSQKSHKIAYLMDNVGKELYFDLALIDFLLTKDFAETITCYLKNQPFFVSDALPKDFLKTVDFLESSASQKAEDLAHRITMGIKSGRIVLEAPPFLATRRMFRNMPDGLQKRISKHDLTIFKGDVNFRKLVEERHWDPTTAIEKVAGYFPTTALILRTQKAELVLGMTKKRYDDFDPYSDNHWQTNGKRGLIAFLDK